MFYPDNPDRLRTNVLDLLAQVAPPRKPTPKALIAPHADPLAIFAKKFYIEFLLLISMAQRILLVVFASLRAHWAIAARLSLISW